MLLPLVFMLACDSQGPFQGYFRLDPAQFTGDPVPCQFFLEWVNAGIQYEVFRSTGAGIEADPSAAVLLGITEDVQWTDSASLVWGDEYYYAIRADGDLWSNEVSALAPPSPYPSPCELSAVKTGFTDCLLEWTESEGDVRSYTLLRSSYSNIEDFYYFADTLSVSFSGDSASFADHFASPGGDSYYAVAVADSNGLTSFSNIVTFVPGGEIPWQVTDCSSVYGLQGRNYLITAYPQVITGARKFPGYSLGGLYDTDDCSVMFDRSIDPVFITVLTSGSILASHLTSQGYRLSIFTADFSQETVSRGFPPVSHCIQLENGLFAGGSSSSFLLHGETLETLNTFGFGFSGGVLSRDGARIYLNSGSGVLVMDAITMGITGTIPGYYTTILEGNDGNLYCGNSQRIEVYQIPSLSMETQFIFPEPAATPEVALLGPECRYVYVPVMENGELAIRVWDMQTGESPGTVRPQFQSFYTLWDFLPSPSGDYLWCLGYCEDSSQRVFRVSL